MKKAALEILTALSLLTLFIAGVDAIMESATITELLFRTPGTEWKGLRHLEPWELSMTVSAAMLLLPILTAAVWVLGGRDDAIETTTSGGGRIRVSPGAVERIINRDIRANVVEVIKVTSRARQGKKRQAAVLVAVAVSDRTPVPQVEKAVREQTVQVLRHLLGGADPAQVRVVVRDIEGARIKGAAPKAPADRPQRPRERPARKPEGAPGAKAALPAPPKPPLD
jgi:hypothetical protein